MPASLKRSARGSSPRLRGTELPGTNSNGVFRFIPAPAGNGSLITASTKSAAVHPRACGERYSSSLSLDSSTGSSPRLRGTVPSVVYAHDGKRFIPAPAGNGLGSNTENAI